MVFENVYLKQICKMPEKMLSVFVMIYLKLCSVVPTRYQPCWHDYQFYIWGWAFDSLVYTQIGYGICQSRQKFSQLNTNLFDL
jgi:hypothetical protein